MKEIKMTETISAASDPYEGLEQIERYTLTELVDRLSYLQLEVLVGMAKGKNQPLDKAIAEDCASEIFNPDGSMNSFIRDFLKSRGEQLLARK